MHIGGFQVYVEECHVVIARGFQTIGRGPRQAVEVARRLFVGARVAREQRRRLTPRRYGLPGLGEVEPETAFALAAELFACAARLEVERSRALECVVVLADVNGRPVAVKIAE